METNELPKTTQPSVTYKQLGVLSFAFALGVVVALLVFNANSATPTSFSTTELIGFVLTVILSGASIVLAISAIALGRSSEQAVIRRSDESIRLQNEVFTRTTEALQRIEASTGVTEKRIEDIISGRVGDISHQIAELATEEQKGKPRSFAELEKQIRESLLESLRTERLRNEEASQIEANRRSRRIREEEKEKRYQAAHEKLLHAMCKRDHLKVEKAEHGSSRAEGEDLFDGLFRSENYRVGISTFREDASLSTVRAFLANAVVELHKGTVDLVLAVPFVEQHSKNELEGVEILVSQLDEALRKRILVVTSTPDEAPEVIAQIEFSNNEIHCTQ